MRAPYPILAAILAAALIWPVGPSRAAEPVKGEVSASVANGFARLVFKLTEEVESSVKISNNIVIVTFKEEVDIPVDRIIAPGFVTAARLDPDRKGMRLALGRKVTVNAMPAAEWLYVDLLPENWTGVTPGLPQDVVDELAKRAREAEKKARAQRALARQNSATPIRVRVAQQPSFTRYVFDLPELISIGADRTAEKLALTFDATLKFDLADVLASLPAAVSGVESELDKETVIVRFSFAEKVDVRTFREDNNYVVDLTPLDGRDAKRDGSVRSDGLAALAIEATERKLPATVDAPQTVPAQASPKPEVKGASPVAAAPKAAPPEATRPVSPAAAPALQAAPLPAVPPASAPPAQQEVAAPQQPATARPAPAAQPGQAMKDVPSAPAAASATASPPPAAATPPVKREPRVSNASRDPSATVRAELTREGESLNLYFPFARPTPAAVFLRADTLWLVFDGTAPMDISPLNDDRKTIRSAVVTRHKDVNVILVKLERPRLVSAAQDDNAWSITIGGEVVEPTRPLTISRNVATASRASVTVPFENPNKLHRIVDPEAGDTLLVVTALGPARGFVKAQDFVEFRAVPSTHGVVIQPHADDITAEIGADRIALGRPSGLTLSAARLSERRDDGLAPVVFDAQLWGYDRQANFNERKEQLVLAAAAAPESKRTAARIELARFYMARDMAAEAKGVLDVALSDNSAADNVSALMLHGIVQLMLDRPDEALKGFSHPALGNLYEAPLWRALAHAQLGKWTEAREGFRQVGMGMGTLPLELQRVALTSMLQCAIEVGDYAGAATQISDFESIGVPREMEATMAVLSGRLAEGLGRTHDALNFYSVAADSWDRPKAAQGRLRHILLRRATGQMPKTDTINELETLTTVWRGDDTEVEALQLLGQLYTEEGRYRDAFMVMRTALSAHRNSEVTRRIQEEAAKTFDSLFLAGKGDALPAIDALALFYDFRELTPIGRRGDEMIRRLADRLVSVDLLYQASELLQHQVDNRLQGAARAQIAARLAIVYLMDRKPEKALATLRATRTTDLTNDLRNQRLLVEGRVLSDIGRPNLALEVIANIEGPETVRLRADILWTAKRWREAAEQIEILYGDRWQQFEPFTETERTDILRAGVGYALGEDSIGLTRFRERYAGKIGDGPDRRAFDVVTSPLGVSASEFRDIARRVTVTNTLDAFLRDLRARYPNTGALPAALPPVRAIETTTPKAEPAPANAAPIGRQASR